jgi:hypothetical protein
MSRGRSPIDDLRLAIDCLPVRTRRAMLEGVRSNEIIVGAYADRAGGVCPMLAAHRAAGARASRRSRARGTGSPAPGRARRATPRELRMLEGQLEAGLLADGALDLGAAIAEHEAPRARAPRRRERWAGLRPGRRRAEDEAVLHRLEAELAEAKPEREPIG